MKPAIDTRFGRDVIKTRVGLEKPADIVLEEKDSVLHLLKKSTACVLVDEAQFLAPKHVEELSCVASLHSIPVICYGLRTDFMGNLFPAAAKLMAAADTIEEVKTLCASCGLRKATYNLKIDSAGLPVFSGPVIELGCEERYIGVCSKCYSKHKIRCKEYDDE